MASRKPFSDLSRSGKWRRLNDQSRQAISFSLTHNEPDPNSFEENVTLAEDFAVFEPPPSFEAQVLNTACSSPAPGPVWDDFVSEYNISSSSESEESNSSFWESREKEQKLADEVRQWALHFTLDHVVISSLLTILKRNAVLDQSLPSDARVFLSTPGTVETQTVIPGLYSHIGLVKSLESIWHRVTETVTCIDLLVGIDGLPLFKSSPGEFWPIMVSILNVPSISDIVFPVGIYYGKKKPSSCKEFMANFISELKYLIENGIVLNGKKYLLAVKGFCCDAPAKAFLLGIKGHAGYSSCTKCKQEGHYFDNKVTFPDIPTREDLLPILRTTEGFLCREDPAYHIAESPLLQLPNLDFISAFPVDYMHLVCLGVMRTLLYIWSFNIPHKLPHRLIEEISLRLTSLKSHIPQEFCRKPRSLHEVKRWKATEFRQFLLYTGPIVLKNILNPDLYSNFLELHVAMRILTSPKYCKDLNLYAHDLLTHFLHSFKNIYGQAYMTHNFHGLLHLAENIITFDTLDNCSAFKFENYLYSLKKLIRKGDRPLQQVIKRLAEKSHLSQKSIFKQKNYPFCSSAGNSNHKLHFKEFVLTSNSPNCYCKLRDGTIASIQNIVIDESQEPSIIIKRFRNSEDLFARPLCHSTSIGIACVSALSEDTETIHTTHIEEKLVLLPIPNSEKFVSLSLSHSD